MIPPSMHSSGSKLSASPVRRKKLAGLTLATNSSIFDEEVQAEAFAALGEGAYKRKQLATSGNVTTLSGTCKSNEINKAREVSGPKNSKQTKSRRKRADRSVSPITAA
jgi:hypothetical protein